MRITGVKILIFAVCAVLFVVPIGLWANNSSNWLEKVGGPGLQVFLDERGAQLAQVPGCSGILKGSRVYPALLLPQSSLPEGIKTPTASAGDVQLKQQLLKGFQQADVILRRAALALTVVESFDWTSAELEQLLIIALKDSDEEVRVQAVSYLKKLPWRRVEDLIEVLKELDEDPSPDVRQEAEAVAAYFKKRAQE